MVSLQKPLWDGFDINSCIPKKNKWYFLCRKGFPSQNLFFCPRHVRLVKLRMNMLPKQHARRGVNIVFLESITIIPSLCETLDVSETRTGHISLQTQKHKKPTQKTVLLQPTIQTTLAQPPTTHHNSRRQLTCKKLQSIPARPSFRLFCKRCTTASSNLGAWGRSHL